MKKVILSLLVSLSAIGVANAQFVNEGWQTKVPMSAARWGTGSCAYQTSGVGKLQVVAGVDASNFLSNSNFVYNSTTTVWSALATLPSAKFQGIPIYYNNKIYYLGGYIGNFVATNTCDVYDISTNTWSAAAPMPTGVGDYGAVLHNGKIYIICGYNGTIQNLVQVYDIATNTWAAGTPYGGTAVYGGKAAIAKGKIIMIGGYTGVTTTTAAQMGTINPNNPLQITWSAIAPYPAGGAWRPAGGSVNSPIHSMVYFTGGDPTGGGTAWMNATWGYDVDANLWKPGPNKPTSVSNVSSLAPVILNDTLFMAVPGGIAGGFATNVNEWLKIGRASGITTTVTGNPNKCLNQIDTIIATNLDTNLRWQQSTDNINFTFIAGPSGTNDTLFTPITQNTWYRVVSYGHVDSAISTSFAVTLLANAAIGTQPTAQSACVGAPASFSVTATGAGISYQWRKNGSAINDNLIYSGTQTPTLTISDATNETGAYDVVVTGTCNTVTSTPVALTVNPLPTAVVNTSAANICGGGNADITITLSGTSPYNVTYFDGTVLVNLPAHNNNSLTYNVTPLTETTYYVSYIQDANGCTAVNAGLLDSATVVVDDNTAITTQPLDVSACSGTSATISVVADGAGLTYDWYNGVTLLSNGPEYTIAGNTLTINNATGMNGLQYHVVVSGNCGPDETSNTVTLTEITTNTWTGATNNFWSVPTNWSCGAIPIVTTNVIIPDVANDPIVDITGAICNSIVLDAGGSLMFNGINNALEVKANITDNGTFDASLGKLILSGTGTQNVPDITYKNLDVMGGSTKILDGDVRVTGILNLNNGKLELANNDLVLDMAVAQMGGNANSYAITNGTGVVVARNMGTGGNPDAVTFHVGINDASYTPVTLENTGDADTFSVMVIEHVYVDGVGTNPAEVTEPVVDRTWMISENTPGGSFAKVTPQWNAGDETNGFDLAHTYVVHFMGGEWTSEIDSAIFADPANGSDPYTAMEDSVTSFSPFAVASSAQFPLAIRLTTITAKNAGANNLVEWKSAKEDAGDKYELEHSVDAKTFNRIATIAANGKASAYKQWHENAPLGINYYRVKMIDAGGKYNYSKVVSAMVNATDAFSIEAFPNPVNNTVSILVNGSVKGNGQVTITDVTGRIVKTATHVTGNKADINVSGLSSGVYLINYTDDVHTESVKINKQ